MFFHPLYFILVGPAIILALWAQARVKSAFTKYSQVGNSSNMTGAEAAAQMLGKLGMRIVDSEEEAANSNNAVAIVPTRGMLSDHYDPRKRTLRLSRDVYNGRSLASVGIACHEAGHAIQHAKGYAALEFRNTMVPVASFGSWAAFPIILLGFFMQAYGLIQIGIALFAVIVLFQLITLPVEYNASNRAKEALWNLGVIRFKDERKGVAAVLDAAAWTYVAAALSSVMTLLYYIMIFTGGARD
ncbi:MAG: zinc metallopeptidase [Candidatus Sumerlaeia bacterium]